MALDFPNSPSIGDTFTALGKTWSWNGESWKVVGSAVRGISLKVSDTAPSDPAPVAGDMWYESDTGRTFTYYDGVWVELGNTASVTSFIADADSDTRVHVEESADEDTIRFDTAGTERLTITSAGHVLPSADVAYDLGSSSFRFRDLYLSGSSIDLGGVQITSDGTSLSMPPISSVAGDFTVDTSTLHVDSTNNRVGIGTTSPSANLNIDGGTSDTVLRVEATGADPTIMFVANGAGSPPLPDEKFTIGLDYSDPQKLKFSQSTAVDTATRMVIDGDGRVGIGTTSPAETLDVQGNISQGATGSNAGRLLIDNTTDTVQRVKVSRGGATGQLAFHTGSDTEHVRITNSGNVGIGTTSPAASLEVVGTSLFDNVYSESTSNWNFSQLRATRSASNTANTKIASFLLDGDTASSTNLYDSVNFVLRTDSAPTTGSTSTGLNAGLEITAPDTVRFGTSSAERVRIDSSGNVGIGTSSPSAPLHVGTGHLRVDDTGSDAKLVMTTLGQQDWSIGIDYSDAGKLKFSGSTDVGTTTRLTIDSAGNVGINDSSPSYTLDVNGTGRFTGAFTSDASIRTTNPSYTGSMSSPRWDSSFYVLQSQHWYGHTNSQTMYLGESGNSVQVRGYLNADRGFRINNPSSGDGDDYAVGIMNNDWNCWADIFSDAWIGGTSGWGTFWAGSSGALYRRVSTDTNPNEFVFVGAGNKRFTFELNTGGPAFFDGTLTQNAYDYAEYFEWQDGNPDEEDRRGLSVILVDGGYIRPANENDNPEDIIGVVSGTAAVLGDAAMFDWQGKYVVDEWGSLVTEDINQVSWSITDENGEVERHSYDEDQIPEGLEVPEDASYHLYKRGVVSESYDPNTEYVPRDKRPEWGVVGLLGKVRVRNTSPKNPRWKYIKTVGGKELWLIR